MPDPIDVTVRLEVGDRIRHQGGAEFVLTRHHPDGWWELDSGRVFDDQITDGEWFLVDPNA